MSAMRRRVSSNVFCADVLCGSIETLWRYSDTTHSFQGRDYLTVVIFNSYWAIGFRAWDPLHCLANVLLI
jgi:hypothetical protein